MRLDEGDALSATCRLDESTSKRTVNGPGVIADRVLALSLPRAEKPGERDRSPARNTPARPHKKPATSHTRVADGTCEQRRRGVADPDLNNPLPF